MMGREFSFQEGNQIAGFTETLCAVLRRAPQWLGQKAITPGNASQTPSPPSLRAFRNRPDQLLLLGVCP